MKRNNSIACYEVIIRHYQKWRKDNPDSWLDYCLLQKQFADAVTASARAVNHRNNIHPHQCRIGRQRLVRWADHLTSYQRQLQKSQHFDSVHHLVKQAAACFPEGGIGKVTVYDTAHRIAAKRELYPDKIYLHAGTEDGAVIVLGNQIRGQPYIKAQQLPQPFHELDASAIEDILCIYKDELSKCTGPGSALQLSVNPKC